MLLAPPRHALPIPISICATPALNPTLLRRCRDTEDRQACAELTEVTFWFALWYTSFTILSTAVGRRTRRMRLLLNPVSSGVVQL